MENMLKKLEQEIAELEQQRVTWSAVSSAGVPKEMEEKLQAALAQAGFILNFEYRQFSEQLKEYVADRTALHLKLESLLRFMDEIKNEIEQVRDKFLELEYGNNTLPNQAAPTKDPYGPGCSY